MGLSADEVDRRVKETAIAVGIDEDLLQKSPFELSGGQKRRVAIAGVMAMEPKILILDEPTAGLDPKGREKILNLIKAHHKRTGCTVLIVSHSMEDIARYANKILVMNKSQIFCYGMTAEVFKRADEISKMGLTVPQITRVINELKNRGIHIEDEVYTVKYAKEILLKYLSEKEGKAYD